MDDEILFITYMYFMPLLVCIFAAWVGQIIHSDDFEYSAKIFAIIPIANMFAAIIYIIILVGWIGIFIMNIPNYIMKWRNSK